MVKLRGCSVHVFHCKSELVSADKSKKGWDRMAMVFSEQGDVFNWDVVLGEIYS